MAKRKRKQQQHIAAKHATNKGPDNSPRVASASTSTPKSPSQQQQQQQHGDSDTPTTSASISYRDIINLHTPIDTHLCATERLCVPCAYKICAFDVALDKAFTKAVHNARPETCPRYNRSASNESHGAGAAAAVAAAKDGTMGFRRGMSVLTVGDGDLTYSLAVARIILPQQPTTGTSDISRLVATSYESKESLLRVYPDIQDTITELKSLGATISYQVDATRLVETLPESVIQQQHQRQQQAEKFHRIVWNFPCSAVSCGQDGQNDAMEFNKQLVRGFVCSAVNNDLLHRGDGEIHMLHKTKPPFNQWKIETVALEGLYAGTSVDSNLKNSDDNSNESGRQSTRRRLDYKGRVVFDRCLMPPYVPRKALDKKSFTAHDACHYIFGWESGVGTGRRDGDNDCQYASTIHASAQESSSSRRRVDMGILPVTKDMVLTIRRMHLVSSNTVAAATTTQSKGGKSKKKRRREE